MQISNFKTYLSLKNLLFLVLLAPVFFTIFLLIMDDSDEYSELGLAVYSSKPQLQSCENSSLAGEQGSNYGEQTLEGVKFNVHTPENYNKRYAHPLLVVYAPARANRAKTEKMTGLTFQATSAGFIIAYADHPPLSPSSTIDLGSIPQLVAKKWCIDEKRVYLTGHSDGGTVSMALAFMNGTREIPTAIAPSAAGITYRDLNSHSCPQPLSVMVMHSKNDHLFPGFGSETSGWWAACNECSPIPKQLENGCIAYQDCKNNVKTWYCEGDELHAKWPQRNQVMLDFLASSNRIRSK